MADLRCPHCHRGLQLVTAEPIQGHSAKQLDLAEAVVVYSTEQRVTGAWSPQWEPTAKAHLLRFVAAGHPFDRGGVGAWKVELLAAGKSPRTVNSHLASLGAFAKWLVARGDLAENPAQGQSVRTQKVAASDERLALETREVRALLDYTRAHAPSPGHWLLVWGMAYTGARNEELAQLRLGDLKTLEGITVLDMATMDDGQRRKTHASRRFVPVHTEFMAAMAATVPMVPTNAAEANLRSLMGLSPRDGRWSYTASRWVNDKALVKLKEEGLVRDDNRLTLYSLRHAVVTQLKHKGVSEDLIAELVGHTNSSMTTGRYGKRYPVEKLKTVVEMLHW